MAEQKENITINAVLPGVVPSQFIGQEMRETFGEDG
jgi:NAD(P)-dependent dehydrogenase (short-subunit alcohol dehydrogenase family)